MAYADHAKAVLIVVVVLVADALACVGAPVYAVQQGLLVCAHARDADVAVFSSCVSR